MSKKLKRALSSILAFAMVLSMITIMNVSTAFAATDVSEIYYGLTSSGGREIVIIGDGFTSSNSTSYLTGETSFSTTLSTGETITTTNAFKWNSTAKIDFTVTGTADLTVYYKLRSSKSGSCGVYLHNSEGTKIDEATTCESNSEYTSYTFSNIASGSYYIARDSSKDHTTEGAVVYAKLVDTYSDDATTYTLSGSCNLKNADITIGTETITTDNSGSFTISKLVDGDVAPWTDGEEVTVSSSQYKSATVIISVSDSDATSFTIPTINLEVEDFNALTTGSYTGMDVVAGLPNFDISGLYTSANITSYTEQSPQSKIFGSFAFKLAEEADVTFTLSSGGSSDCAFTLKDEAGTTTYLDDTVYGKNSTNENASKTLDFTATLPAGTYVFSGPTSGSQIVISSITVASNAPVLDKETSTVTGTDGTVYYIVGVSEEEAIANSSYKLVSVSDPSVATEESSTVYNGVIIEDTEFSAADFGYTYVVGFIIESTTDIDVSTLSSKYEMSFTPISE